MSTIPTSRNTSYQLERSAQPTPDYRFAVALASTVLNAPTASTQSGYVSNLSRYEHNCYGGNLDITA